MVTAILTPGPLTAAAIETRGGWSAVFTGDQAAEDAWPALDDFGGSAVILANAGTALPDQLTAPFRAEGIGSARVDKAVAGTASTNYVQVNALPANPAGALIGIRTFGRFFTSSAVTDASLAEYTDAAVAVNPTALDPSVSVDTINGDFRLVVASTPGPSVNVQVEGLGALVRNRATIIDVLLDAIANEVLLWVNGVDFTAIITQLLVGETLTAPAQVQPTLRLLNLGGIAPAQGSRLTTAAFEVATARRITLDQHRADAAAAGVREDGLIVDQLGGWTWAFSPGRLTTNAQTLQTTLPADPGFGGEAASLLLSGSPPAMGLDTEEVRREGLGAERIHRAIQPQADTVLTSPAIFPVVDSDLHFRSIIKVASTATASQRIASFEYAPDLTRIFIVRVEANRDLVVEAPSGFIATFAAVVPQDRWVLLDVFLSRTGGVGGAARIQPYINNTVLPPVDHAGLIADIPAGAALTLLNNTQPAPGNAATETRLAFLGVAIGRVLTRGRHQVDAAATGLLV